MKLAEIAISRKVTVMMMVMIVFVLGFVSFTGIPVDMLPDINLPIITVSTSYTGAGPQEIESLITKPLERSLSTVSNFKSMTSNSAQGRSTIMLRFTQETDMDFAALDVREKVDLVKSLLPDDVGAPTIMKLSMDMMPLVYIGIKSEDGDLVKLKRQVEDEIQSRLERLDGVASVSITGGRTREILVEVDPIKLSGYGLTIAQLGGILRSENLTSPGGEVLEGAMKYTIRVSAEYQTLEEMENIPIPTARGQIRLTDVAAVYDTYKDLTSIAELDGQPCVLMTVQKQSGSNTVSVSEKVNAELEKLKAELTDLTMFKFMDQAEQINDSISNVTSSALYGGILAILVILLFMRNIRATIIIGVAIPISIIGTFVLMYFSGLTLNMMTLGGLALGVGMLVDNSIVMLENIFRHIDEGKERVEAAKIGSTEVGMAIIASTLTTIVVFVPISFVKDNMAITLFTEMALTVTYSLGASLIVSLTLVPSMAGWYLKQNSPTMNKVEQAIENAIVGVENIYKKCLWFVINHRKLTILVSLGIFIASIVNVSISGKMEFFPSTDTGEFTVNVEAALGTNLNEMKQLTDRLTEAMTEVAADNDMEYEFIFSEIGGGATTFTMGSTNNARSTLYCQVKDVKLSSLSTNQLADALRKRFGQIAGVKTTISVSTSSMGSGMSGAPISIELKGDDLGMLAEISEKMVEHVSSVQGTRQVTSSLDTQIKELQVTIDRSRAEAYNVSASTVATVINSAVSGSTATKFRVAGTETDVTVRFDENARRSVEEVERILITSNDGRQVPLYEIADVKKIDTPATISRSDQVRRITVTAALSGERAIGDINAEIRQKFEQIVLPSGYEFVFGGDDESMREATSAFLMLVIVAMLLVYMVMASQFESLIHPFTVMFTIPLAFIGVVLSMSLAQVTYSVPAFIGIVVLVGVVVNNGIVLVDYVNQLRASGLDRTSAIMQAGPVRLRPIMMTTMTTVLALVPTSLALGEGGEMMQPMAVTVIGGLTFSTLLTLLFLPVLYSVFDQWTVNIKKRFKRHGKEKVAH